MRNQMTSNTKNLITFPKNHTTGWGNKRDLSVDELTSFLFSQ